MLSSGPTVRPSTMLGTPGDTSGTTAKTSTTPRFHAPTGDPTLSTTKEASAAAPITNFLMGNLPRIDVPWCGTFHSRDVEAIRPGLPRASLGAGPHRLLVGVVAAADERSRLDVAESHPLPLPLQRGKFLRMVVAGDR